MLVADFDYFLARLRSLEAELLLQQLGLLGVTDMQDLLFSGVLLHLFLLEHVEQLFIELLSQIVHLLLDVFRVVSGLARSCLQVLIELCHDSRPSYLG